MSPIDHLSGAWQGLSLTVAGRSEAAKQFDTTRTGLAVALGWFLLALILSAAAQSVAVGLPSVPQLLIGLIIQGATLAVLALAIAQSIRFLKLDGSTNALLVPIVYFMALVQIFAIPLNLLGPNVQLIAVFGLALLIWRAALVLGHMRMGIAIAFALLCLMVLVAVPNALYMLLL